MTFYVFPLAVQLGVYRNVNQTCKSDFHTSKNYNRSLVFQKANRENLFLKVCLTQTPSKI